MPDAAGCWDEALSQADALRPALVDANDFTSLAFLNACALLIELARGRTDLATMGDSSLAYARAYDEADGDLRQRSHSSPAATDLAAAIALIELVATVEGTRFDPERRPTCRRAFERR